MLGKIRFSRIKSLVLLGGFTINLIGLILTVENLYEHKNFLILKVTEKISKSVEKTERRNLKLILFNLSSLPEMTAGGYFDVSKKTLTSMLSVR